MALFLYLCRAVSTLCCGNEESFHVELRVRTLCELVINENYYLQPSITSLLDSDGIGQNALVATSGSYDKASCSNVNHDLARIVLRLDCLATSKNGEWSNMFHVYGLASVLKSLYTLPNKRIRPLFHRKFPHVSWMFSPKIQFL